MNEGLQLQLQLDTNDRRAVSTVTPRGFILKGKATGVLGWFELNRYSSVPVHTAIAIAVF